ncbi:MAG TPA: DcaP family trimeric outer membrane transporter [Marinobacter sp.]|nr:DcaP family trimeric outer membrane transporter [Marinobacter sp.]
MNSKRSKHATLLTGSKVSALSLMIFAQGASAITFEAGDVNVDVYGYAQLTASYDLNEDLSQPAQNGSFTPLGGSDTDREGHFGASANQSRIGINVKAPDNSNVVIEGDFYTGDFRLRHAYFKSGSIIAGQTWSNFASFVGMTSTLDFNGQAARGGYQLRTAQFRYTNGPLSVAVEEPKSVGIAGGDNRDSTPAFTLRYEDKTGFGAYSLGAVAKQTTHDDGNEDDSVVGWGTFAALKFQLAERLSIQGVMNYTDGANNYLYQSGAVDAYMDGGKLESIAGYGGALGASFSLKDKSSINAGVGFTEVDYDDAIASGAVASDSVDETRKNVFLNYQWMPMAKVLMGVEYQYWDAQRANGDSYDANRLMFISRYSF